MCDIQFPENNLKIIYTKENMSYFYPTVATASAAIQPIPKAAMRWDNENVFEQKYDEIHFLLKIKFFLSEWLVVDEMNIYWT